MEAMILAAGLGTRLRPLTYEIPKALVEVGGVPMLEHVARRLVGAGARRLIVNVHLHAERVVEFIERRNGFGVEVLVSYETERVLETGGGLKHAAGLFEKTAPFILHNADVLSDVDLRALYRAHERSDAIRETGRGRARQPGAIHRAHDGSDAIATLAVRPLASDEPTRCLLFDEQGVLSGYGDRHGNEHVVREPAGRVERLDFCGIHVLSPRIFERMTETGVFSIITTYLRLAREGEHIRPHRIGDAFCLDVGEPERLASARARYP